MAKSRAGWRLFKCGDCRQVAWMATRDRFSPSQELCGNCDSVVFPISSRKDDALQVDNMGNLVIYPPDEIVTPGVAQV